MPRSGPMLGESSLPYLHVLVGSLLPLLVQCARWSTCEVAGEGEDGASGTNADHGVEKNFGILARRSLSTRAVWAKGDPVCC